MVVIGFKTNNFLQLLYWLHPPSTKSKSGNPDVSYGNQVHLSQRHPLQKNPLNLTSPQFQLTFHIPRLHAWIAKCCNPLRSFFRIMLIIIETHFTFGFRDMSEMYLTKPWSCIKSKTYKLYLGKTTTFLCFNFILLHQPMG